MAYVKPFAALRPDPLLASKICELPYDVVSTSEARAIAAGNPLSFFHVSKPEIDLPDGTDPHSMDVYGKGWENFLRLIRSHALAQDLKPHFYLYQQIQGGHTQTGIVATVSCEEYLKNIVRKHELTRPDKEDDRVRHIEVLNAQTGPAFLTYRARPALDQFVARHTTTSPAVQFTASDGVRHTAWVVSETNDIRLISDEFAETPILYIADGHHRSAAAARVFQSRNGSGESSRFLAVIFPHNQMRILPYNRALKDLNGLTTQELFHALEKIMVKLPAGNPSPSSRHQVSLYLEGKWNSFIFKTELTATKDPIESLDVTLLQKHLLAPIFGVDNPRTSERISFVGGIRGPSELEKIVDAGDFACAFSMYPTSIEELFTVADAGGIMPPKSTWFEPKLRDAMFCHMI